MCYGDLSPLTRTVSPFIHKLLPVDDLLKLFEFSNNKVTYRRLKTKMLPKSFEQRERVADNMSVKDLARLKHATEALKITGELRYDRDFLYDQTGMKRMKDSYMLPTEKSPQERLWKVCHKFSDDPAHALRLYEYTSRHWLSLPSPMLAFDDSKKHALPISCYLIYCEDSVQGLLRAQAESCQCSVQSGGVSQKLPLRTNLIQHVKHYDAAMMAYKQMNRRGAFCPYVDINHPEIESFIDIRKPTGDENFRANNINHGVVISDSFMEKLVATTIDKDFDDSWDLVSPKVGDNGEEKIIKTVRVRDLWKQLITTRFWTGEPVILFGNTANRQMNPYQKAKGMRIEQSNLCTEIVVPTSKDRSSMCTLASYNLVYFDEYSADKIVFQQFVEDVMRMLDNVIEYVGYSFTQSGEESPFMKEILARLLSSVVNERNIAQGFMGFHSYLQSMNIALDDLERSRPINHKIFSLFRKYIDIANKRLSYRGEPGDIVGSGKRFAYTTGIAPTATSSIIMGNTSPGIEPFLANVYTQTTLSGLSVPNYNPNLQRLFESKGLHRNRINKIWDDIIRDSGSVQNISSAFLSDYEKRIYRTFVEIDQTALINLAIDRQRYIDQAQSLNLFYSSNNSNIDQITADHILAWKGKLPTLYYLRSTKASKNDNLGDGAPLKSTCTSCES